MDSDLIPLVSHPTMLHIESQAPPSLIAIILPPDTIQLLGEMKNMIDGHTIGRKKSQLDRAVL